MKRLIFVILAPFYLSTANAQQISADQAKAVAIQFLNSQQSANNLSHKRSKTANTVSEPTLTLAHTWKDAGKVQLYAFNQTGGGFVITGGDEVAEPILAWSEEGSFNFETINPNLRYWLESYQRQILYASDNQLSNANSNIASNPSSQTSAASRADVPILVSTRWDQMAPYYNSVKGYTNKKYYTGCVATAMAQVMKTHEWPEVGVGSHTYTDNDYSKKTYTRNFYEHTYDWSNMRNTYSSTYTDAEATAVAELMFDAGVSVNMAYSTSGSAAYTEDVTYAMVTFFNYDEGIMHKYRSYYTDDEWTEIIYDELSQGRPVIYGGSEKDGDGGHCFICDGYQASSGKFHFNWGWSGDGDCYCSLSAIKTSGYSFNYYQDMICGIQKPNGGQSVTSIIIADDCYLEAEKSLTNDTLANYNLTFGKYNYYGEEYAGFIWNDSWKAADVVFTLKYTNTETQQSYSLPATNPASNRIQMETTYGSDDYPVIGKLTLSNLSLASVPAGTYNVTLVYKDWNDKDDPSALWQEVRAFTSQKNYITDTVEEIFTDTCEAPIIAYESNTLTVVSPTEGAKCYYKITDNDVKSSFSEIAENGKNLELAYVVSAYATKQGMAQSATTKAVICWLENLPDPTEVISVNALPAVIQYSDGGIHVTGLPDDTVVGVYTLGGILLGTGTSANATVIIPFTPIGGGTVIVKIGDKAIKYQL